MPLAQRTSVHLRLAWALVPTSIVVLVIAGGSAKIANGVIAIDSAYAPLWSGSPAPPPAPVLQPHIGPPRLEGHRPVRRPVMAAAKPDEPVKAPPPQRRAAPPAPPPLLPWDTGLRELMASRTPALGTRADESAWQLPRASDLDLLLPDGDGATGLHLSSGGEGSTARTVAIPLERIASLKGPKERRGALPEVAALRRVSAAASAAPDHVPNPSVERRLPPERVAHVIHLNRGRLRACYQQGLVRNPSLAGRVAVRFAIEPDGRVVLASAVDELGDEAVVGCMAKAFQSLRFPATGGAPIAVTFPLRLSPGD